MAHEWSQQQREIFEVIADTRENIVVRARAGSGKTTTAVAAIGRAPAGGRLMTAFNKSIAADLKRRVDRGTVVQTLHSIGLKTLNQHLRTKVEPDKGINIARAVCDERLSLPSTLEDKQAQMLRRLMPFGLKQAVGLVKSVQPQDDRELRRVLWSGDCINQHVGADQMVDLVRECLARAVRQAVEGREALIDFDDMIYLPRKLQYMPARYATIVVDETQDMSRGQLWLVRASGARVIAIGDERQAIYKFRGADTKAIQSIIDELDAIQMPLSMTYRCPKAVTAYVRETISGLDDFVSRNNAPEGHVDEVVDIEPEPGDFVLSRYNSMLVPAAMRVASDGTKVCVLGADLKKQVAGMIDASGARDVASFRDWLLDEQEEAVGNAREAGRLDRVPSINDRFAVARSLTDGRSSLTDVRSSAFRLFADKPVGGAVVFSSVHKAKGLEADHVWLLMDSLKKPGEDQEEDNIHYVGATRAKVGLNLVRSPGLQRSADVERLAVASAIEKGAFPEEIYDYTDSF